MDLKRGKRKDQNGISMGHLFETEMDSIENP